MIFKTLFPAKKTPAWFVRMFKLDKKGWALLMIHFCYNVISIIYLFFNTPAHNGIISYRRNPTDLLLPLFICGTILYFFNRKDVLNIFQIKPRYQLMVIMISAILAIVHIFLNRAGNNRNYYFG